MFYLITILPTIIFLTISFIVLGKEANSINKKIRV